MPGREGGLLLGRCKLARRPWECVRPTWSLPGVHCYCPCVTSPSAAGSCGLQAPACRPRSLLKPLRARDPDLMSKVTSTPGVTCGRTGQGRSCFHQNPPVVTAVWWWLGWGWGRGGVAENFYSLFAFFFSPQLRCDEHTLLLQSSRAPGLFLRPRVKMQSVLARLMRTRGTWKTGRG